MADSNQGSNQAITIGRDVESANINQIGYQQIINKGASYKQDSFFKPNLKPFSPPALPTPKVAATLLSILENNHILVLNEGVNVDKSALARHLAGLQSNKLKSLERENIVKEWYRSSDPSAIQYELEEYETCKILILTQATPKDLVGYTLSDIHAIANEGEHFVIVTTELPFAAWHLFESGKEWWYNITDRDVGDCQRLLNELSHEEALSKWYNGQLDSREQLLAIGLSLFDGLFDDQFFSALEAVVEHSWKNRDDNLRALDYCDLDNLRWYFDFIETETQQAIVKIRYPKLRFTCLKIAWKSHRRQILSVLPILVDLVKDTVEGVDRELYSSPIRKEKIRQTISEAISIIGLISRLGAGSREAVESSLIRLAASRDLEVQAVAAQSIAAWRDKGNQSFYLGNQQNIDVDKELFSILESWQTDSTANRLVSSILEDNAQAEGEAQREDPEPADYIKATLAITIGYASLYDPKGSLSQNLYERFEKLTSDTNHLVRICFKKYTLPLVVSRHLLMVKALLQEMVLDEDLISAISTSISKAYKYSPTLVVDLLKDWQNFCLTTDDLLESQKSIRQRQCLRVTIAQTIEEIFSSKHDGHAEDFDMASGFSWVLDHLKFERDYYVREKLLESVAAFIEEEFSHLSSAQFEALFLLISSKETKNISQAFNRLYLRERKNLTDGDDAIFIDDVEYPVWLVPVKRKSTLMEASLLSWIKDSHTPCCQKFAATSYMGFIKAFEDEEAKEIALIKARRLQTSPTAQESIVNQGRIQPFLPKRHRDGIYDSKIIPWIVTRSASQYFKSISHLLPETARYRLRLEYIFNSPARFLIKKLSSKQDNEFMHISKLLRRGLWTSMLLPLLLVSVAASVGSGMKMRNNTRPSSLDSGMTGRTEPKQLPPSEELTIPRQDLEEDSVQKEEILENNPFVQLNYPLDACGDPQPTDPSVYPINLYPVFIPYSDDSLEQVKSLVCLDSFKKIREDSDTESIQVASFLTHEKASVFKAFIGANFSGAEVGEPSKFERPPESPTLVTVNKKGAIQFPQGANKISIEDDLASSNLDRYTFFAVAGQQTVIAMRAESEEVRLSIVTPSEDALSVILNPAEGVTNWSGVLPIDGTYTIDIENQGDLSSYRLFLQVEPATSQE